jgi:hypothetical protein
MITRRQMLLGSVAAVITPIVAPVTRALPGPPDWGYTALGPTGPLGPCCGPGAVGPPGLPGEVITFLEKFGIDIRVLNPDGSDYHLIRLAIEDIHHD